MSQSDLELAGERIFRLLQIRVRQHFTFFSCINLPLYLSRAMLRKTELHHNNNLTKSLVLEIDGLTSTGLPRAGVSGACARDVTAH